ncbi:hypothetical protein EON73_03920 [bacterium]|nr:MAG: hypothetical protein EON73_03920 [bacterium]
MNTENKETTQSGQEKTVLTCKINLNLPKTDHLECSVFENDIFQYNVSILKDDQNTDAKPDDIISTANVLFNYISPDGFTISHEDFGTEKQADLFYEQWKQRYEGQGYYSSSNYGRIPLDELDHYCGLSRYVED